MAMELSRQDAGCGGPLLTVVMDGYGVGAPNEGNAIHLARTPNLDRLQGQAAYCTLRAHGLAVGLPSDADMGNSEVGHNALGAGRVFSQGAKLVNRALASGDLFRGAVWQELTARVRERKGALHFLGLLSDGNVHSHIKHLIQLIEQAAEEGIKRVFVHVLLDGRDVPERSCLGYLEELEEVLARYHQTEGRIYQIASGGGRMTITMDRYEADWAMVERGYQLHVLGKGRQFPSAKAAVETFRAEIDGIIDQELPGFVVGDAGRAVGPMQDGDSVIFFNFRGDRAIEISRALGDKDFDQFPRPDFPDLLYAGMMEYDGDYHIPAKYLVEPPAIDATLGEYLTRQNLRQFACSETQKFGHVTYFWNGNRSGYFDDSLETYQEVPSDTLPFEERPWMKAAEITDATIAALKTGGFDALRINYANADMVGHTGDLRAAVMAAEAVDHCLGRLLAAVKKVGGVALVTADHGNADEMIQLKKDGSFKRVESGGFEAKTSHTKNPVPLYLWDSTGKGRFRFKELPSAGLSNLAATSLEILGFRPPQDYDESLIQSR